MKKLIYLVLLLATFATCAYSERSVVKRSCAQTDAGNVQCVYEVTGQKTDAPDEVTQLYGMSNMPYALCAAALCKYDREHSETASCQCKVFKQEKADAAWRNASVGPLVYDKAKPEEANGEIATVTSNFSFANMEDKSKMNPVMCSFEKPVAWANCFGVRCVTNKDPQNGLVAACECPVVKTTSFVSVGPKSVNECEQPADKVWSSATIRQSDNDFAVMEDIYKQFYPG